MEFLKVLISTNQNRSTNQNGAFTQNGVVHKIYIKQSESRIHSQLKFVILINQNEVFTDFKLISD